MLNYNVFVYKFKLWFNNSLLSFFLWCIIPLVLISIKNNKEKFNLVGNIGPMKRIIYELPFDISFLSRCEVKYLKNENKHFYDLVPLDSSKTTLKH